MSVTSNMINAVQVKKLLQVYSFKQNQLKQSLLFVDQLKLHLCVSTYKCVCVCVAVPFQPGRACVCLGRRTGRELLQTRPDLLHREVQISRPAHKRTQTD